MRGQPAPSRAELRDPAAQLKTSTGLNLLPTISRLGPER
jgi:hypothetical protein